jgi:tricorn protease
MLLIQLAFAQDAYLRQPDIHNDQLVLTAEGDLWIAPTAGGVARRLTSRVEEEFSAKFSPDGKWVAYTGAYDGNTDIYLIPAAGGSAKRLTWHPAPEDVVGWAPDGKSIIFRSLRTDPNTSWRLYSVPVEGGDITELPIGYASRLDIEKETGRYAFTRLGREAATWKRYRGGTADDIWVGDPKKADYTKITTFEGQDAFPMWYNSRVYFLSDSGGTANIWSMKPDGTDRTQHTKLSGWDARWPAMGPDGRIVFMFAGDVFVFNPADNSAKKVDIQLPGERSLARIRYSNPDEFLTWFALAPNADRVMITTRGELFSIPTSPGVTLSVTQTSGARESFASYSPDGTRVVYVTDVSGEEAIVTADAWGRGNVKTIKAPGTHGWHWSPLWSPDGKKIAWSDETRGLYIAPSEGGNAVLVDSSVRAEIKEFVWAPGGRYLAYSKLDDRDFSAVYIYDTGSSTSVRISQGSTFDHSPAWDPDGRYLYYVSSRYVDPMIAGRDFQVATMNSDMIIAILLRPDVPNPLAENAGIPPVESNPAPQAKAEEVKKKKAKADKKKKREDDRDATEIPEPVFTIDFTGISSRAVVLPVLPGSYGGLSATTDRVFFMSYTPSGMRPAAPPPPPSLNYYEHGTRQVGNYMMGVMAYDLVADADKLVIYLGSGQLYVFPTAGPPGFEMWEQSRVKIEDAVLDINPKEEWKQIFYEAWRHQRDFFWDKDMSGLDWVKIRDQYATLLPRLATRGDLNDLIGEMIGELGTSHTYVGGGDLGYWSWGVGVGMLGADLVREGAAFKIARIYRGDAADNEPSPLLEPGLGVKEGEYILAFDNQPVQPGLPPEAMLQGRADRRVVLTVNSKPVLEGSRQVVVTPIYTEYRLRYVDWVRRNREYVAEKSGGKLGYVHIPDMGVNGLVAFETWFYPQADKAGLVVDVRWNRGGFVSQILLEKLRRPIDGWVYTRYGIDGPYPYARRQGPFVVLTNEFAGSDGDIFPTAVQIEGLAPVIGMRSWGGVVGIRADKPMIDGGFLSQPEYAFYFKSNGWGVENHGVDPDIVVPWLPQEIAAGKDPQLDRAIAEALERVKAAPPVPVPDPKPKKNREAFEPGK